MLLPVNTIRGIFVGGQKQRQRQLVVVGDGKYDDDGRRLSSSFMNVAARATTTVLLLSSVMVIQQQFEDITLSNIPQMLSSGDSNNKPPRIQRPKSRKAESCTIKCVGTCIRGGDGSPGEGPLNIRRPLVVFKQGFRSRQYCLVECSDICNLIKDGDDGP